MPRNILNVNFNLRNPSCEGETPINLIIRYNNQKFIYSTAEKIHPKYWQLDKKKKGYQRVKQTSSFPEFVEFNSRLDNMENDIKDVFRRYQNDNNNEVPTIKKFRDLLDEVFDRKITSPKNLLGHIDYFIDQSQHRTNRKTGRLISPLTIRKYKTVLKHLKGFIDYTGHRLEFEDIDMEFYDDFKKYLMTQHNHSTNSIAKDRTTLKVFLNDATEKGVNKNLIFRNNKFVAVNEKSDSIYLTNQELIKLFALNLTKNKTYEIVRDLFLIGCYTGLRYSDYSVLKKENIKNNQIHIETYKTGERLIIPCHKIVTSILKKYEYELPQSITNQKTNQYLKEIAKLVPALKIKVEKKITKGGNRKVLHFEKWKLVSTHTARRSFATNLFLSKFPSISIMKITGHRTEGSFMQYIKMTPEDTAKELKAHWNKIGSGNK